MSARAPFSRFHKCSRLYEDVPIFSGLGKDFRRVRYFGKVSMELLRFVQGLHI